MRVFFFLFIIIPIIEMWLLIRVGSQIGALSTIFLVFLTAAVGLALLRQQGFATLLKVNQRMQHGQLPATEILEGIALAVGGALLLTPGFITDGFGFICLIPATRRLLISAVIKRGILVAANKQQQGQQQTMSFTQHFTQHEHKQADPTDTTHGSTPNSTQSSTQSSTHSSTTIDGEYRRED
jgi:UPF0716 protein FxsA